MTLAADPLVDEPAVPDDGRRRRRPDRAALAATALVALAVAPLVIGSLALVGETWEPMGDWASLVLRTSQVGTPETPLIGAYSMHGFAHPGPLLYWVAAPAYRLLGEDPRSLLWTGASVNVVTIVALAAVAWRRGRWPLLFGALTVTTLLLHGLGPLVTVDIWNPCTPLFPFLLTLLLAWDAALGRRRAVLEAVLPATYAMQAHLAFVPLVLAVAAWALAWRRWGPRPGGAQRPAVPADAADPAGQRWPGWRRRPRGVPVAAAVLLAVLWAAPAVDSVADRHNPGRVVLSLSRDKDVVGLTDAPALVGSFLRFSGWADGAAPLIIWDLAPVDGLVLAAGFAVLVACVLAARRRDLPDVGALATLGLALLLVSIPAASQLNHPTWDYLTEWLKVVGALVWFAAGWTVWRVAEPSLQAARRGAGPLRAAAAVGTAVVVAGVVWAAGDAARLDVRTGPNPGEVAAMRTAARAHLDPDVEYRVETSGSVDGYYAGFPYWLIEDGFDVVTADGAAGLKWGRDGSWVKGQPWGTALVVAVHYPGTDRDDFEDCVDDPTMTQVYRRDPWTPAERRWEVDLRFRRMTDAAGVTEADEARAAELYDRGPEVAMVVGDRICGIDEVDDPRATA